MAFQHSTSTPMAFDHLDRNPLYLENLFYPNIEDFAPNRDYAIDGNYCGVSSSGVPCRWRSKATVDKRYLYQAYAYIEKMGHHIERLEQNILSEGPCKNLFDFLKDCKNSRLRLCFEEVCSVSVKNKSRWKDEYYDYRICMAFLYAMLADEKKIELSEDPAIRKLQRKNAVENWLIRMAVDPPSTAPGRKNKKKMRNRIVTKILNSPKVVAVAEAELQRMRWHDSRDPGLQFLHAKSRFRQKIHHGALYAYNKLLKIHFKEAAARRLTGSIPYNTDFNIPEPALHIHPFLGSTRVQKIFEGYNDNQPFDGEIVQSWYDHDEGQLYDVKFSDGEVSTWNTVEVKNMVVPITLQCATLAIPSDNTATFLRDSSNSTVAADNHRCLQSVDNVPGPSNIDVSVISLETRVAWGAMSASQVIADFAQSLSQPEKSQKFCSDVAIRNFNIEPVSRDGECLFHCFSSKLEEIGLGPYTPAELRSIVAERIVNDYRKYGDFLARDENQELRAAAEAYANIISLPMTQQHSIYGGQLEVTILAEAFQLSYHIFQTPAVFNGQPQTTIHSDDSYQEEIFLLFNSHFKHYDRLCPTFVEDSIAADAHHSSESEISTVRGTVPAENSIDISSGEENENDSDYDATTESVGPEVDDTDSDTGSEIGDECAHERLAWSIPKDGFVNHKQTESLRIHKCLNGNAGEYYPTDAPGFPSTVMALDFLQSMGILISQAGSNASTAKLIRARCVKYVHGRKVYEMPFLLTMDAFPRTQDVVATLICLGCLFLPELCHHPFWIRTLLGFDGKEGHAICRKYVNEVLTPFYEVLLDHPEQCVLECILGYHAARGYPFDLAVQKEDFTKAAILPHIDLTMDYAAQCAIFYHSGANSPFPSLCVHGITTTDIMKPGTMIYPLDAQFRDIVAEIKQFHKDVIVKMLDPLDFETEAPQFHFRTRAEIEQIHEQLAVEWDNELSGDAYSKMDGTGQYTFEDFIVFQDKNDKVKALFKKARENIRARYSYPNKHGFWGDRVSLLLLALRDCVLHQEQNFLKFLLGLVMMLLLSVDIHEGQFLKNKTLEGTRCLRGLAELWKNHHLRRVAKRLYDTLLERGVDTCLADMKWRLKAQDTVVFLNLYQNIFNEALQNIDPQAKDLLFSRDVLQICLRYCKRYSFLAASKDATKSTVKEMLLGGAEMKACLQLLDAKELQSSYAYTTQIPCRLIGDLQYPFRSDTSLKRSPDRTEEVFMGPGLLNSTQGGEKRNGATKKDQFFVDREHDELWNSLKRWYNFGNYFSELASPDQWSKPNDAARTQSRNWLRYDINKVQAGIAKLQLEPQRRKSALNQSLEKALHKAALLQGMNHDTEKHLARIARQQNVIQRIREQLAVVEEGLSPSDLEKLGSLETRLHNLLQKCEWCEQSPLDVPETYHFKTIECWGTSLDFQYMDEFRWKCLDFTMQSTLCEHCAKVAETCSTYVVTRKSPDDLFDFISEQAQECQLDGMRRRLVLGSTRCQFDEEQMAFDEIDDAMYNMQHNRNIPHTPEDKRPYTQPHAKEALTKEIQKQVNSTKQSNKIRAARLRISNAETAKSAKSTAAATKTKQRKRKAAVTQLSGAAKTQGSGKKANAVQLSSLLSGLL